MELWKALFYGRKHFWCCQVFTYKVGAIRNQHPVM